MKYPMGRYVCSETTVENAQLYLNTLKRGEQPGALLDAAIRAAVTPGEGYEQRRDDFLHTLDVKTFIALLMNTRRAQIFAESDVALDGSHWNIRENAILADMVFTTTDTCAFNNGAHQAHVNHGVPLAVNYIFASGALLRNGFDHQTSDMLEVLRFDGNLDEEAYYRLYERRLLPGLLAQNRQAKIDKTPLVVNIPGMGLGQFAGQFAVQVKPAFPRVLRRFFTEHAAELDMVHTVNYDPYERLPGNQDPFAEPLVGTTIRLLARPLLGLPSGAQGQTASQLEFPKDGTNYNGYRLVKIVAWDPFSFPGNDIWLNQDNGFGSNGRETDDGVSFASSDVIKAMIYMGQFAGDKDLYNSDFVYNPDEGIYYVQDGEHNKISYSQLADCKSLITPAMIDFVDPNYTKALAFHAKIKELDDYVVDLRVSHHSNPLAKEQADILAKVSSKARESLGAALHSLAHGFGVPIMNVDNLIDEDDQEKLGEHLSPILRWVKEFIALFATLVIGFVAVTAYNAYTANAAEKSFSFQDIGFFSKTDSVNKMEGVIDEFNHALMDRYTL